MREYFIGEIVEFTFPDTQYFSYSSPTGIGEIAAITDGKCVTKVISPRNERGEIIPITKDSIIRSIDKSRKKKSSRSKPKRKICKCKK